MQRTFVDGAAGPYSGFHFVEDICQIHVSNLLPTQASLDIAHNKNFIGVVFFCIVLTVLVGFALIRVFYCIVSTVPVGLYFNLR